MDILFGFFSGLILSLLVKAFIEPAGVFYLQRAAYKLLPSLFKSLDPVMPKLIQEKSGQELSDLILEEIFKLPNVNNEKQAQQILDLFLKEYNPVINASKLSDN